MTINDSSNDSSVDIALLSQDLRRRRLETTSADLTSCSSVNMTSVVHTQTLFGHNVNELSDDKLNKILDIIQSNLGESLIKKSNERLTRKIDGETNE